ncbi:MAG: ABC transporter permease subunit [Longimicrobiales bacterium]
MKNPIGGGSLGILFRYEIKMLLRDTRTILIAVVAPLVIFPAYILAMNFVEERQREALQEATYTYAVSGSRAPWAEELVEAAIELDASDPDTSRVPVRFQRKGVEKPEEALESGDLHLVIQGVSAPEWNSISGPSPEGEPDSAEPAVPAVRVLYRGDSDFSNQARRRLTDRILEVRTARRDSVYRDAGFPVAVDEVAPLHSESVATSAREAGAFLGMALMPFLVLLMLSGGSIVAVDAISGEKERGTLETLLTTAADRREIVRAKLLAVIAVGLAVAVINVVNLVVYLVVGLLELPAGLAAEITFIELILLLILSMPVAVLVAAALLLLSGAARSFKEYQIYFYPVFLAFALPSLAAILPGIELRSAISLVPLAGVSVAVREILEGNLDLPFIGLAFLSTGALALWLTHLTQEVLSNEKLISGTDLEEADLTGGAALFPRHVFRWFLGLWVVSFMASLWFGESLGIRGQLVVNLVGIFFGGSLLMARWYRLDFRKAFGLRFPHPAAWGAALIGAPASLVVGVGLAQVVNTYIFPVPEQVLENFGQSLLEPRLPVWQMILFLAVMPGIFEELAFRGVLLHGLRNRIRRPWLLALTVGAIFGVFHLSLFRIVPTAFLGFILTWVVLFSGSVFPAMLWHALNNAAAIAPDTLEWIPEDVAPEAWWVLPAGLVLLASLWVLKKTGPGGRE